MVLTLRAIQSEGTGSKYITIISPVTMHEFNNGIWDKNEKMACNM
jgi:hypothetical protein